MRHALTTFLGIEARSIRRDSTLLIMATLPVLIALLLRWLVPLVENGASFSLEPYYVLMVSTFAIFVAPVLLGYVSGVLMLDERDEGTLQAIRVTPLPMWRYLAWKLAVPLSFSVLLTMAMIPVLGILPFRMRYVPAIAVGAMWAPLLALFMACVARNKVEGFVLMRVSNGLLVIPMLAWFFPRFELLIALFPAYWPMKTFWLAAEQQNFALHSVVGAIYHGLIIYWLYQRLLKVVGRS